MSLLDRYRIPEGGRPEPTADAHNAVVDQMLRGQFLGLLGRFTNPFAFPSSWQMTASPFDPPAGSTLDPKRAWRIDIGPGTILDELPKILYRRVADPRGWKPLADYALPNPGDPDYDPIFIERDILDDPEDPPCLVVTAPAIGATAADDFTLLPDASVPAAFNSADLYQYEVWSAHVILSAAPFRATYFAAELPPPRLVKYRLYTLPKLPAPTYGIGAGGWLELATLYFLRDPKFPSDNLIAVKQREYWPLWAMIVQPGSDLPQLLTGFDPVTQQFADLLGAQLENDLEGAASVEFWSV